MSYESNTGLNVSNQYGPRAVGGWEGQYTTSDNTRQYVFDFSEQGPLLDTVTLTGAGRVVGFTVVGTAPTSAKIDTVDIKGATAAVPVNFTSANGAVGFKFTPASGTKQVYVDVEFAAAGKAFA